MKLLGLAFFLAVYSISVGAQTANDLNTKYGVARDSYEVRPGIFMTVRFATDGRVCQASIEKRHVRASGTIDLDSTFMSIDEMKPIIDELAPRNQRGNESKFSGMTIIVGGGDTTSLDYDNVVVSFYGNADGRGIAAVVIQWKKRGCQ